MSTSQAGLRWEAQPRQIAFLRSKEDEVLYGGAAGGGKTDALLVHGITVATNHPGARVMFVRRTFADLNKPGAAIDRSRAFLTGVATWRGDDYRWTFANGSQMQFVHLDKDSDVYDFQGSQADVILFDELTQFSSFQYEYLRSRLRSTVDGLKTSIRSATNPGGIGHGWVRERWIDAAPWGEAFNIGKITARFIPAKVTDNAALLKRDPGYVDRLDALPEDLRRAYRDGDWDQFEGQFFTEWKRHLHVIEPFRIPDEWPRWRGIDWGIGAPFCCLWGARAPDGRTYIYRELYGAGLVDRDQAMQIQMATKGEWIRATFADPSMWNKSGIRTADDPHGTSHAREYMRAGLPITKANNDRKAGWNLVRTMLDARYSTPDLQVFSTCTNLIRTLPNLVYSATDPEDLNTKGEDHASDACRYLLMGMGRARNERLPSSTYGLRAGEHGLARV